MLKNVLQVHEDHIATLHEVVFFPLRLQQSGGLDIRQESFFGAIKDLVQPRLSLDLFISQEHLAIDRHKTLALPANISHLELWVVLSHDLIPDRLESIHQEINECNSML